MYGRPFTAHGLKNRRQTLHDGFCYSQQFIKPRSQVADVCRMDMAERIGNLGILVQVVGADAKEPCELLHIREVKFHDIAVECHLPEIGALTPDPGRCHLFLKALRFALRKPQRYRRFSFLYNTSSSLLGVCRMPLSSNGCLSDSSTDGLSSGRSIITTRITWWTI